MGGQEEETVTVIKIVKAILKVCLNHDSHESKKHV